MNKIRSTGVKLLSSLIVFCGVQACQVSTQKKEPDYKALIAKYGTAFNEERKKDSLPILPAHWKVINKQPGYIEWGSHEDFFKEKGYIMKSINFNDHGKIIYETDIWYSGKKFPCGEDQKPEEERLFLTFDFRKMEKNKYPWAADASCSPGFWKKVNRPHHPETHQLIIDSVLSEWGMKRLNW